MAIHRLDSRFIDKVTKDGLYADGNGLNLQVTNGGRGKSWLFRYARKPIGEDRRLGQMGLGSARKVSLIRARGLVEEYQQQIARGEDPLIERDRLGEREKTEYAERVTFKECALEFHEHKSKTWVPRNAEDNLRVFEKYFFPPLGALPMRSIGVEHLEAILAPDWHTKPSMSVRLQQLLYGIFQRAKAKGIYLGENPAALKGGKLGILLGKQRIRRKHFQALPFEDMPTLMARIRTPKRYAPGLYTTAEAAEMVRRERSAIQSAIAKGKLLAQRPPGGWRSSSWLITRADLEKVWKIMREPHERTYIPLPSYILQFIILTVARPAEATELPWREIDKKRQLWILPPERHKRGHETGKPHIVPLSTAAMEIVVTMESIQQREGIETEFIFGYGPADSITDVFFHEPPGTSAILDYLRRILSQMDGVTMKDATVHGMRSTFSNWANESDFRREHIEKALNHDIGNESEQTYARNVEWLNQRRILMEAWAKHCLQSEPQQAKVIPLRTTSS